MTLKHRECPQMLFALDIQPTELPVHIYTIMPKQLYNRHFKMCSVSIDIACDLVLQKPLKEFLLL